MLGRYLSGLKTAIHTERMKTAERLVIRKVDAHPRFYAMDWCDYKWVKNIEEAMVFHSMEELEHELACTVMRYEAYYTIVRV